MKNNQKGFTRLGILIAVLLGLVLIGGSAYYLTHQNAILHQEASTTPTNTPLQTTPSTQIPPVTFLVDVSSGSAPFTAEFTIEPAVSPSSAIDFGDGSPAAGLGGYCIGLSCGINHTYTSAGAYTATLKDSSGAVLSSTRITVTALTATPPTQTKTYTNSQYGFSLQYPADVQLLTTLEGGVDYSHVGADYYATATPFGYQLVSAYSYGTNGYAQGYVYVDASTNSADISSCLANAGNVAGEGYLPVTTYPSATIDGVDFTYTTTYHKDGSWYVEDDAIYKTLQNNTCYLIDKNSYSTYEPAPADWNQTQSTLSVDDQNQVSDELNAIVRSFKFANVPSQPIQPVAPAGSLPDVNFTISPPSSFTLSVGQTATDGPNGARITLESVGINPDSTHNAIINVSYSATQYHGAGQFSATFNEGTEYSTGAKQGDDELTPPDNYSSTGTSLFLDSVSISGNKATFTAEPSASNSG